MPLRFWTLLDHLKCFSVASQLNDHKLFDVFILGENLKLVTAVNGLSANPKYDYSNCSPVDIGFEEV